MINPSNDEISKLNQYFAVKCNNDFWSVSEGHVESDELPNLLTLAFASLYHWSAVGTEKNINLANMAVARAFCLNNSLHSLFYAKKAYDCFDGHGADWIQAFTNAILSHALLISGEIEKSIPPYEKALSYQSKLSKGDRDVFDVTFQLIPDPR